MDQKHLNDDCKQIWEELGSWWDESVQDGDYFHRAFVFPAIEKLLALQGGTCFRRRLWKWCSLVIWQN